MRTSALLEGVRRLFTPALVAWFTVCAAAARAEGTKQEPEYQDLVREATREFDAGNFVEARTLFEHAHALKPSARTLRGLGSCSYELKHYVQAATELQAALNDARNPLTVAQRAEVGDTLEKAKRFVATLVIEVEPKSASIELDGRAIEARKVTLEAGDHSVRAQASGFHDNEQAVTLAGGQTRTLQIELAPFELSPAAAARTQADAGGKSGQAPSRADSRSMVETWWFWTAVGVVVAGSAVGLALALSRGSETLPGPPTTTGVTLHTK
jgi:tetratricopeptide (TPR) repeat protein